MVSKVQEKEAPRENTDHFALYVRTKKYNKATKKKEEVTEKLDVFPRKCIPATQTIQISFEAWEHMQSKDSCPLNVRPGTWIKMTKKDRLETHLRNMMLDRGGKSMTYEVLED